VLGHDGSTDGDLAAGLIDADCRSLLAGAYVADNCGG
jgi:hypothetical protein